MVGGIPAPDGDSRCSTSPSVMLSMMSSFSTSNLFHGTRINLSCALSMTSTDTICRLAGSMMTRRIFPHTVPLRVLTTHGSLFIGHLTVLFVVHEPDAFT